MNLQWCTLTGLYTERRNALVYAYGVPQRCLTPGFRSPAQI